MLKMVGKEVSYWEEQYIVLIELNKPYFASEVFCLKRYMEHNCNEN